MALEKEFSIAGMLKFDGNNFQAWKFQMKFVLDANCLFDIVTGERKPPNAPVKPKEPTAEEIADITKWKKDNAKAAAIISSAMTPIQLENLLTCDSAKSMWDKLKVIHEQKSANNVNICLQTFYEARMQTNESGVQYIARLQNMASNLRDLDEEISEKKLIAKVLGGLPSKFKMLKTAWDSVDSSQQTIDMLQERLIKEEKRLCDDDEESIALVASHSHAQCNHNNKNFAPRNSRSCNHRTPSQGQNWSTSNPNIVCHYCNKKGHISRNCDEKRERQRKQNNDNREAAYSNFAEACIATTVNSQLSKNEADFALCGVIDKLMNMDIIDAWITDSGASQHLCFRREWFHEFSPCSDSGKVILGDDGCCEVKGSGTILVDKFINGTWVPGSIENVLYVPRLRKNLLSVGVCTSEGYNVVFRKQDVEISIDNEIIAQGKIQCNKIYRLLFKVREGHQANIAHDLQVWHERAGHINKRSLKTMADKNIVEGVQMNGHRQTSCEACHIGKAHRQPFNQIQQKKTYPGEFFHTDVCGPMDTPSLSGARYFLTFKDDSSCYRFVYFLKHKSDVYDRFVEFERLICTKFNRPMTTIRSDNGGEYMSNEMKTYLAKKGIKLETTAPYTPQQNGRAERDNRTIVESARTMMLRGRTPRYLWAEAVNTAIYILNRTASCKNPSCTPYEVWTGQSSNLGHLRIFGCVAYMHIPKQFRKKLDAKAKKLTMVGYQGDSKNYRLYDPSSRKVIVSRDVTFDEYKTNDENDDTSSYLIFDSPWESDEISPPAEIEQAAIQSVQSEEDANNISEELEYFSDNEFVFHENSDDPIVNDAPAEAPPPQQQQVTENSTRQYELRDRSTLLIPARYNVNYAQVNEPATFSEAISNELANEWKSAIAEELKAHETNGTWEIVEKPENRNIIDSKWVFKLQEEKAGKFRKFKARLCARGFKQLEGVDYSETFASVVRYDTLRLLLAIAAKEDLEMLQFDIKTAFLYGELQEEIFMKIPQGLNVPNAKNKVCKLLKALYGLKQSSRCWSRKIKSVLNKYNFKCCNADNSIFVGVIDGVIVYIAIFVDDGLIIAKFQAVIVKVLNIIKEHFEVTTCDPKLFVGVQIERDRENKIMFLHQSDYANKIIERFNLCDAKDTYTPSERGTILRPAEKHEGEKFPYRELVGSLMFLSIVSRPDISHSVNVVSRFLDCNGKSHWDAAKRILRYIKATLSYGIMYRGNCDSLIPIGYSDSDFAGDVNTRKSTSGYIFKVCGGPITWCAQRQTIVTLSTCEAEYVAASNASREAIWLTRLLEDLRIQCAKPITLFVDNQSAIKLIKNPVFHRRTKHIDTHYHFIREKHENNEINIIYVPSESQLADIFTKALSRYVFENLRKHIGIVCKNKCLSQCANSGRN